MQGKGSRLDFTGKKVLCLCEGAAETDVMRILLEHDRLPFSKDDLIENRFIPRMSVKKVEEKYLSFSHAKPVVVLRIIDSKKEKFTLSKPYAGRFAVETIYTCPEIEILLILKNDDYEDYCKSKSKESPSAYCRRRYGYTKNKDSFADMITYEELIAAIVRYDSIKGDDRCNLYDLLVKN